MTSQDRRKRPRTDRHRFGRVMTNVPVSHTGRYSTLSIAIPGSIVANCQTKELKTSLVGQIARYATIYHVDEIIVFDDKLVKAQSSYHYNKNNNSSSDAVASKDATALDSTDRKSDPHEFTARLLQYCECPQYLRKTFFPRHADLYFAGLLPPLDAPHHVRANDTCEYREGVVMPPHRNDTNDSNSTSLVNCGIKGRPVIINTRITPGVRVTVQIDKDEYERNGGKNASLYIQGTVVSPSTPREVFGTAWGYTTRLATSLQAVFDECPFDTVYDLKIGTSERGTSVLDDDKNGLKTTRLLKKLPVYNHALIVFGGVAGIEECVDADESLKLSGSQSQKLFDVWLNVCPLQGSRTIRSEEAVLITLSKLSPLLRASCKTSEAQKDDKKKNKDGVDDDDDSDGSIGEEEIANDDISSEEE